MLPGPHLPEMEGKRRTLGLGSPLSDGPPSAGGSACRRALPERWGSRTLSHDQLKGFQVPMTNEISLRQGLLDPSTAKAYVWIDGVLDNLSEL